jgi:5-methylcytosine-specific restriction endonuclease McrA
MPKENRQPGDVRDEVYASPRWRSTRKAVIARSGGLCEMCGQPGVSVHHLVPIPELVAQDEDPYDPDVCVLLCAACHARVDAPRASTRRRRERPSPEVGNRFLSAPMLVKKGSPCIREDAPDAAETSSSR